MSALKDLFSKQNIIDFWNQEKSRFRRRTMPGVDGVTRDEFAKTIELHAEQIADRIQSNKFTFQRLRPVAIPKTDGKIRLINVPTISDRLVQRVLLKFLVANYGKKWKIPQSFSSMGGDDEGVHQTLDSVRRQLQPSDYAIKADLSRYFDTIDRTLMKSIVLRRVKHRSLHDLLGKVIDCETSRNTRDERGKFRESGLKHGAGLRQGMPLSPVFAFLFLSDIDTEIQNGFYRYVDDLLFFGGNKTDVQDRFERYKLLVEGRGLKMHDLGMPSSNPKTLLIDPMTNFEFLGIKLKRQSSVIDFEIPKAVKNRIVSDIKEASKIDEKNIRKQKGWVLTVSSRAVNLVRNYRSAYHICSDWEAFEKTLKELQLNMCRNIVDELTRVRNSKDTELLRRLFGI